MILMDFGHYCIDNYTYVIQICEDGTYVSILVSVRKPTLTRI